MLVPMCFGRASLVSQKSGLDPEKLLTGHSTCSNLWVHLTRPMAQDAVWGRSPCLRSRILNTRCVLPQDTAQAAYKHGALEAPQFSQCFPKQTGRVSSGCTCANGMRKDFIHSCRFTPSEKSPCQRNLPADLDVALLPGQPRPCSRQHPSTNQHHRPWWLCSCVLPHLPKAPACVSKAKESLPGYLHLQGTQTFSSIKQQGQKFKHPPLFC